MSRKIVCEIPGAGTNLNYLHFFLPGNKKFAERENSSSNFSVFQDHEKLTQNKCYNISPHRAPSEPPPRFANKQGFSNRPGSPSPNLFLTFFQSRNETTQIDFKRSLSAKN